MPPGGRSGVRRAAWFGLHGKEPPPCPPPSCSGHGEGHTRGARGVPLALLLRGGGRMDGRAAPLQPLSGELTA